MVRERACLRHLSVEHESNQSSELRGGLRRRQWSGRGHRRRSKLGWAGQGGGGGGVQNPHCCHGRTKNTNSSEFVKYFPLNQMQWADTGAGETAAVERGASCAEGRGEQTTVVREMASTSSNTRIGGGWARQGGVICS